MAFLNDDFLLDTDAARHLYRTYAASQPILDYHGHLSPRQIASNRQFENLYEAWLENDHYKWRAMRANGIDERFITGDASPYDKFAAWAATVPHTLRNPLYHWTHLELRRYFGIEVLLNGQTAKEVWDESQRQLQSDRLSTHGILHQFDVRVVCTTDDPAESLDTHREIAASDLSTNVYPTFRPDNATRVDRPDVMNPWLDKLADISSTTITDLDGLLTALRLRHDAFHDAGGRLSDHDLPRCFGGDADQDTAATIFSALRAGQAATPIQFEQFGSFMMVFFGQLDAKKGWTKQMHIGAFRNTNSRRMAQLGPDTGYDSVGDVPHGEALRTMLDRMEQADALPKTILYNLNPADNFLFGTMIGNFQGTTPGKMQWGSGWWYLDQKEGIEWQLNALSNLGLLSRFVGMLTDSRSFLSFPRHEYFRRVLCNLLGTEVESGELPDDDELIGDLVRRICYQNALEYLQLTLKKGSGA